MINSVFDVLDLLVVRATLLFLLVTGACHVIRNHR